MHPNFNLQREIKNVLAYGISSSPSTPFHFHSHIEIYLVLAGKIEIIINDKRKVLGAGEISVAFSYDAHGYRTIKDSKAIYLIIPTDYCSEILPQLSGRSGNYPFIDDRETVKTVSDAMNKLLLEGNEISKRGLIYVILGAIIDKMPLEEKITERQRDFSPEILIYISRHFREELTLSDIAKSFGYNPSYFSRHFCETFGISFIEYLTMLRLRESIILLRSKKKSITECAMESGFGSMRSFYRAFRDEFGQTPKQYFS